MVKSPIHFHCVLHANRGGGGGVQIACTISYVLNRRPPCVTPSVVYRAETTVVHAEFNDWRRTENMWNMSTVGPLTGGPQCRMSILRNGHVPCYYFYNFHVDFKMVACPMSILRTTHVMSLIQFPHVARLHVACRF